MADPTNSTRLNSTYRDIYTLIEEGTFLCTSDYTDFILIASIKKRMELVQAPSQFAYYQLLKDKKYEVEALARAIIANDKQTNFKNLYNALFENSFDGIVVYDIKQQKIADANHAFCEMFGYTSKELREINPIHLLYLDSKKDSLVVFENMMNQLLDGVEFNYTHQYIRKNGEVFTANISLLPVEKSQNDKAIIVIRDLTDILFRESLLQESKANFQSIFKMNPLGISVANMDNIIVDGNEAFFQLFGYEEVEIIGQPFSILYPDDYREGNLQQVEKLLSGEINVFEIEKEYKKKDGTTFMSRIWVNILEKQDEKFFISCIQDFTEQYEKDQETLEREERYRSLFNNSLEGIVVIDFNQNEAIDVNPRSLELFGSNREDLLVSNMPNQSPIYQRDGSKSVEKIGKILTKLRTELKEVSFEWLFKRSNTGELFDAIVTFSPITLKGKNAAVMFVNDLTERKKAERKIAQQIAELNRKNKQLEHYINSNLELESFAYVASHDLKQPLRSIASFAQLFKRRYGDTFDDTANEYMEFIMSNVHNMNHLIEDLLSYSRVNRKDLDVVQINLNDLVFELLEMYHTPENDGVEFMVDELPSEFMGNTTKLRQVFQNLVSNALKFKKKDIIPRIEILYDDLEEHHKITIKDNGIGIEDEFKEKIFLVFQRLHTKVEYEGSGIGLAICKKIIEQHGGEIDVESVYGEGASFSFTLQKGLKGLIQKG